jgi:hypothetical protein
VKKIVKKNNVNPNIPPILNKMDNKSLRETIILIKDNTNIKINYKINSTDSLEIEEHFKEEIKGYLNEKYKDIYEKVSELREKGHDMMVCTFKLMAIPLKIELFMATGDRKEFNTITAKLNEINNAVELILGKIRKREEIYKKRKLVERKILEQKKKSIVKKKVVKKVVKKKVPSEKISKK